MNWNKILFSTHTAPDYMPPPKYAKDMVICSPLYKTLSSKNGNFFSIKIPLGKPFDAAHLVRSLPQEQQPELFIARVDASMTNNPCNLESIEIPKIGLLGDSHHMRNPIQKLLNYATRERFDFFLLDHNKQHAHWYHEAGIQNLAWIPAILLADQFNKPTHTTQRTISFVGQTGHYHPERKRLIASVESAQLPFKTKAIPQLQANKIYSESRIVMNCSLNGDFNLRVFETLAAGGFLLTDRLSRLSGLYDIFSEGRDFVHFHSHSDFIDQAAKYLDDVRARNQVASMGHQTVSLRYRLIQKKKLIRSKQTSMMWNLSKQIGMPVKLSADRLYSLMIYFLQ